MAQAAVQTKSKKNSKSVESATRTKTNSKQNTFVNNPASNEQPVNAFYAAGPVMNLAAPVQAKFETGQVAGHEDPDTVQTKLAVGAANDSYEREADAMSDTVVQGKPAPSISRVSAADLGNSAQRMEDEESVQTWAVQREAIEETTDVSVQALSVQRQSMEDEETVQPLPIQRQQDEPEESVQSLAAQRLEMEGEAVQAKGSLGQTGIPRSTEEIIRNPGVGEPIQPNVRQSIEPHLGADLSGVRVHTGSNANQATASLNARAFTHGNDVFLGNAESSNDVGLMAHETTHVVQQGAVSTPSQPAISSTAPKVQRLLGGVGEFFNDYAQYIPGFTLFTVIIGFNPLIGERVDRNAINLLEGFMALVPPFGAFIFDKLRENSILQSAFEWVSGQLTRLNLTVSRIEEIFTSTRAEVGLFDVFDIPGILRRRFGQLFRDVTAFALSLVDHLIQLIKDAAIGLAENLLADNAAWALIKKVLHYDPLKGEEVTASTVEILEGFLQLIGKEQELEQMRERETLEETAAWLDTQLGTFQGLLLQLGGLFSSAWDAIQPQNLPELPANLQSLATQAIGFLQGVWDFAVTVAMTVLQLIKDALLGWLSTFATDIPGYHLMTVILEQDIFTQEVVLRNATNLIRGFMGLLPGGEQQFQQMQETGVIADAAGRIESIMTSLGISWAFVQELFLSLWNSLTIEALLVPADAFMRILARFAEPISRLFAFVVEVIKVVLELILQLMNFPSDILARIISNAMQAFEDIKRDPIGFLKHMLEAVKLGFTGFFNNILQYLMDGVTDWFFAQLGSAGIEPPAELTLETALDVVMQVLGITIDRLWEKLADRIGQDRVDQLRGAIDQLVGIWNFVRDVTERGIVAVWEYIEAQISNLWNMVIEQVRGWVLTRVIERVVARLLSMLDPTGIMAVVNSFMAFFSAIQSAIEYMREMLMIVDDYVSTIASVARGEVQPGADKMEQGLANSLPVAIGFLANQVGLGNIGDQIQTMIEGVRAAVDEALTWLVDRAVSLGQRVLGALGLGGDENTLEEAEPGNVKDQARVLLNRKLLGEVDREKIDQAVSEVFAQLRPVGLTGLHIEGSEEEDTYSIIAEASPGDEILKFVPPRRIVTMRARIEVADDLPIMADIGERGQSVASISEGRRAFYIDPDTVPSWVPARNQPNTTFGGMLIEPEENARELELVTWNTSARITETNYSHAERQFAVWIEARPYRWRMRVKAIHLQITLSPCGTCTQDLVRVLELCPGAKRNSTIQFDKDYTTGSEATTSVHIGALNRAKWSCHNLHQTRDTVVQE